MPDDPTVSRIREVIEDLAEEIRQKDSFDQNTVLNVHGLVCLMRYAIWKSEPLFKNWILENCKFEINEGILQRVFLHKSIRDNDGVELRIHVFPYGQSTFIHNHQQDFITMCIKGEYDYSYYDIVEEENHYYHKFIRIPKEAKIIPHPDGDTNGRLPGKVVKARLVDGDLIPEPDMADLKFKAGDEPLFVPNEFHHVVNQKKEAGEVITIVARRGEKKGVATTVLQDKSQGHKDPVLDQKPIILDHEISLETKTEIYNLIKNALEGRGFSKVEYDNNKVNHNSDISSYMVKEQYVSKFLESDAQGESQRNLISHFMKSNQFTSVPLMSGKKCTGVLRRPVSKEHESETLIQRKPQSIGTNEHIFGAILWNVVSRDLVVPVIDPNNGDFKGIFSITDIVESDGDFDRSLINSIAKERRNDDGEKVARSFLRRLKRLERAVFNENNLLNRTEIDKLVNKLLLKLGPLIVISPDLPHGRLKDISSNVKFETWIVQSANWPFYKYELDSFDEDCINEALELLKILNRGSDMAQILITAKDTVRILNVSGEIIDFDVYSSGASIEDVIKHFSETSTPIILKNEQGGFGILTTDDFCSIVAIRELGKFIENNAVDERLNAKITRHIITVLAGNKSTLQI